MAKAGTAETLSERAFEKLVAELGAVLAAAQEAAASEKVTGYWTVGQRIVGERLSEDAGSHNTVLREVAAALAVSSRTLQHAVVFHLAYPKEPPHEPLSWAHYRILARLATKKERDWYTKRALSEAWSVRDLQAAVWADLYAGGEVAVSVNRPTSAGYVYKADNVLLVDADTLDVDVDLGFQCWTKRRLRLAGVDAPEAGTVAGRAAKNFVVRELARARTVVLRTHKVDLHGRYVADVFLSPHEVSLDECYREGLHLNALLVAKGHAEIVH